MERVDFMARNIKPTPTLYGKDADRFAKRLKERPTAEKKKFLHKAYTIYKTIQSNPKKNENKRRK